MDPLHQFQQLDGAPALLIIVCYFVDFAMLLTWAGRKLTARLGIANNPSSLNPAISLIGTMASILIGLVIVSLWGDYRAARATVASEATEIRSATRVVKLLAGKAEPLLIGDLRRYTRAVVGDEWPAMERATPPTAPVTRSPC